MDAGETRQESARVYDLGAYRLAKERLASIEVTPGPVEVLRSRLGKTAICAGCPLNFCSNSQSGDKPRSNRESQLEEASFIVADVSERLILENQGLNLYPEIQRLVFDVAIRYGLSVSTYAHGNWFQGIYSCVTRRECGFKRSPDPNAA